MMRYLLLPVLLLISTTLPAQRDITPTSSFEVTGIVKNKLKISVSDMKNFKQDALGDVTVRNHRGEEKSVLHGLKGVLLKTILDSAGITADKPREYSEYVVLLTASDGYKNVYSWKELYNTDIGNHVYIITEADGESIEQMKSHILVLSLGDTNTGRRHLKALAKIEVKKAD